jgi:hypothetical protein
MGDDQSKSLKFQSKKIRPASLSLPKFIITESIGLGRVVTRVTKAIGIRQCGGCAEREKRLDDMFRFIPRESGGSVEQ